MSRFILLGLLITLCGTVHAEPPAEYRCDTEIFRGNEKEPVQASLTIFSGRTIYDFMLTKPEEITVYELERGKVTLIDPQRKIRASVTTDDLLRFSTVYKTVKPESELFSFCTQPVFDEEFANNTLTLRSKCVIYSAQCQKAQLEGADLMYREFADWSSRLNSMRPGNLPPFARMEMNKALAAHHVIPLRIERVIEVRHGAIKRHEQTRSEHLFNWSLSVEDRRRITKVGDYLVDFAPVSIEKYLLLEVANNPK